MRNITFRRLEETSRVWKVGGFNVEEGLDTGADVRAASEVAVL